MNSVQTMDKWGVKVIIILAPEACNFSMVKSYSHLFAAKLLWPFVLIKPTIINGTKYVFINFLAVNFTPWVIRLKLKKVHYYIYFKVDI